MTRAIIVGQSQVEDLLSLKFSNSLLAAGNHPTSSEDTTDGNVDNLLSTFSGNFSYQTSWVVTNSNDNKVKSITVTTHWKIKDPDLGIQDKSISLTTMAWEL
jgi:nicotinamide mononucleotide (NMN) deamidase PncC